MAKEQTLLLVVAFFGVAIAVNAECNFDCREIVWKGTTGFESGKPVCVTFEYKDCLYCTYSLGEGCVKRLDENYDGPDCTEAALFDQRVKQLLLCELICKVKGGPQEASGFPYGDYEPLGRKVWKCTKKGSP